MNSKILPKNWLVPFALAVSTALLMRPTLAAADADKAAVEAAEAQFYVALNSMFTGDLDRMLTVWSHAKDVTYMGPGGGYQIGWAKVSEQWKKQAAMKLGGSVHPADIHLFLGEDLAVVQNLEVGENTNAAGKPSKVSIRATNVFRKENGQWKMVSHHTDLLPSLAK